MNKERGSVEMKKDKELKRFLKKIEKRKKRNDKKNTPLKNPFSGEDCLIHISYQNDSGC